MKKKELFVIFVIILVVDFLAYRQFVFCEVRCFQSDSFYDRIRDAFHFNRLNFIYKGQVMKFEDAKVYDYSYYKHHADCFCERHSYKEKYIGTDTISIRFNHDNSITFNTSTTKKHIKVKKIEMRQGGYCPNGNNYLPPFYTFTFIGDADTIILYRQSKQKLYGKNRVGFKFYSYRDSTYWTSGYKDKRFLEDFGRNSDFAINVFSDKENT